MGGCSGHSRGRYRCRDWCRRCAGVDLCCTSRQGQDTGQNASGHPPTPGIVASGAAAAGVFSG
ncbi:hypothetical protein F0726_01974 [Acidithiobacillus caldus]|nr:hypothetical protein F0726_01974 [Acidithiobacillus caldus]